VQPVVEGLLDLARGGQVELTLQVPDRGTVVAGPADLEQGVRPLPSIASTLRVSTLIVNRASVGP